MKNDLEVLLEVIQLEPEALERYLELCAQGLSARSALELLKASDSDREAA